MKRVLVVLAVVLGFAAVASADLLIGFDFAAYAGSEVEGTSTVAAAGMDSPSLITRARALQPRPMPAASTPTTGTTLRTPILL